MKRLTAATTTFILSIGLMGVPVSAHSTDGGDGTDVRRVVRHQQRERHRLGRHQRQERQIARENDVNPRRVVRHQTKERKQLRRHQRRERRNLRR